MANLNFSALRDLHNSANDLLHSPTIKRALVHQGQEKWVHQVSESSLRMLDVCGISQDILLLVKEHVQDLQFTLRRVSTNQSDIGTKMAVYDKYSKKLKKETLKCLQSLKWMKNKPVANDIVAAIDDNLSMVVDVLQEVRVTSISVVESLLSLISIPWLERKSGKGYFGSKFMQSSRQRFYDISDEMAVQSANKRLQAVEITIEDLEAELECIFRRLIQTRVLLLNILTN
ncbi:4-coumarate--CoA ligase-like 5-like [Hibiscus syriacus]|uniref:4-coumarate--CoA ligase-like 5-like n=1 Tax=Hibiscus syriacus TaxID=106335 RepID=A0A6A2WDE5_HIBSY|nr:uncharacterized protein LOC120197961 [Hibiscus syriacus]KAE8654075.1 4-coumarate--CoA ligase-like 5-like [Hibiscus syriacus]